MNNISYSINSWLNVILKIGLIAIVILAVLWLIASGIANFTESNGEYPETPKKAQNGVFIKATGDLLLVNDFEIKESQKSSDANVYILHGYWRIINNKWRYIEDDFTLDEYFWGDITLKPLDATLLRKQ